MKEYRLQNGKLVKVRLENEQEFLQKYPNATLVGGKNQSSAQDANAGQKTVASNQEASQLQNNTELNLEDGSLESQALELQKLREDIEANDYKSRIKDLESSLDTYKSTNDIDSYNEVAKSYNSLIKEYQGKVSSYNKALEVYDKNYKAYNFDKQEDEARFYEERRQKGLDIIDKSNTPNALLPDFLVSWSMALANNVSGMIEGAITTFSSEGIAKGLLEGKSKQQIINESANKEGDINRNAANALGAINVVQEELHKYARKEFDKETGEELQPIDLLNPNNKNFDIVAGGSLAAEQAVSSIYSLIISAAAPIPGAMAIGVSSYGQEFDAGIDRFKQGEIDEEDLKTIRSASVLKAGAEFVGEYLGGKAFGAASGLVKSGLKEEAVKEFNRTFIQRGLRGFGEGFAGEFLAEGGTSILQDLTDKAMYGDKKGYSEIFKNFVNNGLIGGLLGGPSAGGARAASKIQRSEIIKILAPKQWQLQTYKLQEQLLKAKQNLKNADSRTKDLFKQRVDIIQKKIDQQNKLLESVFENKTNKELESYAAVIDEISKQRDIAFDSSLDSETRDFAKQRVLELNLKLNEQTDGFVNAKVEKSIGDQIKTLELIRKRKGTRGFGKGVKIKYLENAEEAAKFGIDKDAGGGFVESENTIYINQEVAGAQGSSNILGHELLHAIMSRNFKTDNASMKPLVDSFKKYLVDSGNEAILNRIESRMRDNDYFDSDGNIKEGNLEEYFNMFSDLVDSNEIPIVEDSANSLGKSISNTLSGLGFTKVKLETGKDVFDFIKTYNKNVNRSGILGEITKRAAARVKIESSKVEAADSKVVKDSELSPEKIMKASRDAKIPIDQLGKVDSDGNDMTEPGMGNFLYQAEADEVVRKIKEEGYLDNLIASKYKVRPVPEGFVQDVLAELTPHIKAFKPESNDSLFGWIQSQIANKAGNVYNKIYKDKGPTKTVDVDATTSEGAPIVQIEADTDIEMQRIDEMGLNDTEVEERSRLRRDIRLDEGMMQTVRNAVIKTFGTKLPDVSSKKFRKALEKAFRTELKKPIQDMMGGRSEYDLFLRNHSKAIFRALPVETLVQMERNLKPEQRIFTESRRITKPTEVDKLISEGKLPKDTSRTSGPQLHTKKPFPGIDKILAYFRGTDMDELLGYKVGASTLGTRKDKLAMSLGEELAFDATSEVLQDPAVKEKRQGILEIQGYDSKNDLIKVAEKIDRDPNIKFSKQSQSDAADMKNIAELNFNKIQDGLGITVAGIFRRESYTGATGKEKFRNMMDWGRELRIGNVLSTLADHTAEILNTFLDKNPEFIFDFRKSTTGGKGISTFGVTSVFDGMLQTTDLGVKLFSRFGYSVKGKLLGDSKIKTEGGKKFFKVDKKWISENEFVKLQDKKLDILESLFVAIQDHLNKYPNHAWFFFRLIGDSVNNQDHMVRVSAPMKGAPINDKGNLIHDQKIAEEHQLPQNQVGKILLHAAVTGKDISKVMKVVRASYAQIALLETDDVKTRQAGYSSKMPSIFWDKVVPRILDGSLEIADGLASIVRYTASGVNLNNYTLFGMDMTIAEYFGVSVDLKGKTQQQIDAIVEKQNSLIDQQITGEITKKQATEQVVNFSKSNANIYKEGAKTRVLAMKAEANLIKYSRSGKAKGMSTFDFDETLIIGGENFVVATDPNTGQTAKILSHEWPIKGPDYAAAGWSFDFSDFANVRGGKEGPLLQKMKNQIKKYGNKNVFVLTARQQDSAKPIKEWLKSKGIDLPLRNITGLGKSEGEAKAEWMLQKFAEGYNDMYFVDDALPNVKAVKKVLDQLDIKSKVVQAKIKFSKSASQDFNKMLERSKGVDASLEISDVDAKLRGARRDKGRLRFFVPPSAEDFKGLVYAFLGKGEQGNKDMQWFKDNLFTPFADGTRKLNSLRQKMTEEYTSLKKSFPKVVQSLNDKVANTEFTVDNAIRVYLWNTAGFKVPGLSDAQNKLLTEHVSRNPMLTAYADALSNITRTEEGYIEPKDYWIAQNIGSDLHTVAETINRKKFLAEWQQNADLVFSKENLNKIEAIYGSNFREALEDMLYRMKTGSNRPTGRTSVENKFLNWVNGAVSAVMFFNMRSANLQGLSMVNFLNFEDNNIFAASKAFADQKQFWSDFVYLFNSDMLKQRRAGLKIDVSASELTDAFAQGKNKTEAVIKYMLEKGFLPTKMMDSFAIAMGGSTFYRNRVNKLIKEGMSKSEAENQAFLDFQEIAEETQQSSRPDLISMQQASSLGRLILAWANTPMQYTRLTKKALSDIINGRGNTKANVSRIIYYGAVQNIIFGTLQTGLAFLMFGDDEEDKDRDKKEQRVLNGMLDTLLRGVGVYGALVSTAKNTLIAAYEELGKGFGKKDYSKIMQQLINLSPPVGSKVRKIIGAIKSYDFNKDIMDQMDHGINNPAWNIFTGAVEGATNVPLDRIRAKLVNVREAFVGDHEMWQRVALVMGWNKWDLGVKDAEIEEAREKVKEQKKEDRKKKKQEKEKQKEATVKKVRCRATTSSGRRCKNMTENKNKKCYAHQ